MGKAYDAIMARHRSSQPAASGSVTAADVLRYRANPEQKAIDFYVPREEQEKIRAEDSPDGISIIDLSARPLMALWGAAKGVFKEQEGLKNKSFGERLIGQDAARIRGLLTGAKKGLMGEEGKISARDLGGVLDQFQRGLFAETGAMAGLIKGEKRMEGLSIAERLKLQNKLMAEGAKRGFQREDRYYSRDIAKLLSPKAMRWLENNTSFKVFGDDDRTLPKWLKKGMEAIPAGEALKIAGNLGIDSASVPTFLADMALDPLTWIPFGAPLTLLKAAVKEPAKGVWQVASKLIGEETANKITSSLMDQYIRTIAPKFNIKQVLMHEAEKVSAGGGKKIENILKTYTEAVEASDPAAKRIGIDLNKVNVAGKIRSMTDHEDRLIDLVMNSASDAVSKTHASEYAKSLGLNVKQLSNLNEINDLIKKLTKGGEDVSHDLVIDSIAKKLNVAKSEIAPYITENLLMEKGIKRFTNKLARTERDATLEFVTHKFEADKAQYLTARTAIKSKMEDVQKILKGNVRASSSILRDEVADVGRAMKGLDRELAQVSKGATDEAIFSLKENAGLLKKRIEGLNRFMAADTKNAIRPLRSTEKFVTVRQRIVEIDRAINQAQIEGVKELGSQGINRLRGQLRALNNDLKLFRDVRSSEFNRIKGSIHITENLNREALDTARGQLRSLRGDMTDLEREFRKSAIKKSMAYRTADRQMGTMADRYYKGFMRLNDGAHAQAFLKSKKAEYDRVGEYFIKTFLPEHLQDPARKAFKLYNDLGIAMSEVDDPLLKGMHPLYVPRQSKDSAWNLFGEAVRSTGKGKGFLKRRVFETNQEFNEWLKTIGSTPEDRMVVKAISYVDRAQSAIAQKEFKDQLMRTFNVDSMTDLPDHVYKSARWLFGEGIQRFDNPWLYAAGKTYGKVLNSMKFMLTIPNLSFQGRNIMGFPFLAATESGMKHGWNPTNMADAMTIKLGSKGVLKNSKGMEVTFDEFRQAAEKTGYFGSSQLRGDFKSSGKLILGRYKNWDPRKWIGEAFKLSQNVEDMGRYGAAIAAFKSGHNVEEAMQLGKKAMFDYNLMNSPADKALQGIFGFYTFPRRNFPRQIMTMLNDPAQYATIARVIDRMSNREKLSDEELSLLNDFEKTSLKVIGQSVDGIRTFRSLGFFPVEDAYQTFSALTEPDLEKWKSQLSGRLSPLAMTFLDFWYQKDSFYGQDWARSLPTGYTKLIPKQLADSLGLTLREKDKWRGGEVVGKEGVYYGDPDTIFMIRRMPPTSRIISDLAKFAKNISEGKVKAGAVEYATGIKERELDVRSRKNQREYKVQDKLRDVAVSRGGKIFKSLYVPQSQKNDPISKMKSDARKRKKEIMEKIMQGEMGE